MILLPWSGDSVNAILLLWVVDEKWMPGYRQSRSLSHNCFFFLGIEPSSFVLWEHLEEYYESSDMLHRNCYCLLTQSYHGLFLSHGCIEDKFFRLFEFLSVTFFLLAIFTSCFNWARTSLWEQSQGHLPWRLSYSNISLDILSHFSKDHQSTQVQIFVPAMLI